MSNDQWMSNLTVTSEKLRSLAARHSHTFAVSPDLIVACAARIEELDTALADVVRWLDRTDRKGCAHTEHARQVLDGER